MNPMIRSLIPAALASLSYSLVGCSASTTPPEATESEITNGQRADGAEFDSVVRVTWKVSVVQQGLCTGVLVAPQLVLTAAHCVQDVDYPDDSLQWRYTEHQGMAVEFHTRNQYNQTIVSAIPAWKVLRFGASGRQPHDFDGFGVDIALIMLDKPVSANIAVPIPVRATPLSQSDVGKELTMIGYGLDTIRSKGRQKLMAVSGKPFQQMFDTRSAFDSYLQAHASATWITTYANYLWDDELNSYGQEVQTWGQPYVPEGSMLATQGCSGDSGGPLLESTASGYRVVGLVSNGVSDSSGCLLGERVARIGQEVIDAVAERATATDPFSEIACPADPTPNDTDDNYEDTACSPKGMLIACSSDGSWRQRTERCEDRGLHCNVLKGIAACR